MSKPLRVHEVRKLTGLDIKTLGSRVRRAFGFPDPVVKVGRERLWRREDVESWLARDCSCQWCEGSRIWRELLKE